MKGENRGRKANFFSFCGDEIRLYLGKKSNCSADNTISNWNIRKGLCQNANQSVFFIGKALHTSDK